jgi:PAS domain-containing protein
LIGRSTIGFVETNPAFERQAGLKDAVGRTARELVPCLEEHWFEAYGRVALTGEPVRFENGSDAMGRWFDVHALRVGAQEARRVAILFNDITERRHGELALAESEARFRLMADAVPQIVWITDAEGGSSSSTSIGPTIPARLTRRRPAAEVAADHVHPDDGVATIAAFNEARRTGTTFLIEHRIRSGSGDYRWFLVRGEPYRDTATGEIARWFGASVDIHDRKLAEAAPARA